MIGRPHHVAFDCVDPRALAAFYSALLGLPITFTSDDWVVVATSEHASGFAFQRAPGHRPPSWPDPHSSQQAHLDVMVDDLADADAAVVALGATRLLGGDHVYADPAGHPFCLVARPSWAPSADAGEPPRS
jgi:catechol 2,3-dioxygenase-like lactoylglutathione lyase family enzyme